MPRSPAAGLPVPAPGTRDDKYYTNVIGRAREILAALRTSGGALGLAKRSVFRLLHTLEVSGYIERTADGACRLAPDFRVWGTNPMLPILVGVPEVNRDGG